LFLAPLNMVCASASSAPEPPAHKAAEIDLLARAAPDPVGTLSFPPPDEAREPRRALPDGLEGDSVGSPAVEEKQAPPPSVTIAGKVLG